MSMAMNQINKNHFIESINIYSYSSWSHKKALSTQSPDIEWKLKKTLHVLLKVYEEKNIFWDETDL